MPSLHRRLLLVALPGCLLGCLDRTESHPLDGGGRDLPAQADFAQAVDAGHDFATTHDLGEADGALPPANLDVNFCIVQFPATATTQVGVATGWIYGQVYQAGLTDTNNQPAPGILGQLGVGPFGSDPRIDPAWSWVTAMPNAAYDFTKNNDEYEAMLTESQAGTYSYAYRFSISNGAAFTYCDTVGNGGNSGLPPFDPTKTGTLTVN